MGSRLYPKLNDAGWLREKYQDQKMSLEQIAEIVGAKNHNSVRQALMRAGIKIRNISQGLGRNREDYFVPQQAVIDGGLLGDAFLEKYNKGSDQSYPSFNKRNKFYDHIRFVARKLFYKDEEKRIFEEQHDCNGVKCQAFKLSSYANPCLLPFFKQWYPAETGFVKRIPPSLDVTAETLLHWFLDDGSTSYRKQKKTTEVRLVFCSESFKHSEQEILCTKIKRKFGIKMNTRKCSWGTGFRIHCLQKDVANFFEIIGVCPVGSLQYKWK